MQDPTNNIGNFSKKPGEQAAVADRAKDDPFGGYVVVMALTCVCMSAYASGSAGTPINWLWPLPLLFVIGLPILCIWKNTFSINTGSVYLNVLVNGFVGLVYYLSILVVLDPVNKLISSYWWHFSHPPLG